MISQVEDWLQESDYVDFKDKDNNSWQVGLILSKSVYMYKVRSEGWSSKFDQFIQIGSNRIQPFRTQVRGYTGQLKNPAVRDHWKFNSQKHQQRLDHLKQFLVQRQKHSRKQITQLLRGEHYFYIDFLMSNTYENEDDLSKIYEYFEVSLAFISHYMTEILQKGIKHFLSNYEEIEDEKRRDWFKSYAHCFYELFDSVKMMFGNYPRHLTFAKNNETVIKQLIGQSTHEKHISKLVSATKLDEIYLKLLAQVQEEITKQSKILFLSIPFLYSFFHLFACIDKAILYGSANTKLKQERKKILLRLFQVVKLQLSLLEPRNLKNHLNQKQLDSLLNEIKLIFFKFGLEKVVSEWVDKTKLQISLLMIQSDVLERKLKGISRIKDFYDNFSNKNDVGLVSLTQATFSNYLRSSKIMAILFEQNEHPEILKKSSELCQLFYKSELISIDEIQYIWTSCCHKHEAVRKIIFQLWIDICPYIGSNDVQKFMNTVIEENMPHKISQNNISAIYVQIWQIQSLFNLILMFLKYFEDLTQIQETISKIGSSLIKIGYQKILQNQESNSVQNLLHLFSKIVSESKYSRQIIQQIYQNIQDKKYLKLNIKLLTFLYLQPTAQDLFIPNHATLIIISCLKTEIHSTDFIDLTFKLIDQISIFTQDYLEEQEFNQLWNLFSSLENQSLKTIFYNWILKQSEGLFGTSIYQINNSFSSQLKDHIFMNILCDSKKFDYINMTIIQFKMFIEFMIHKNYEEKRIDIKNIHNIYKIIRAKETEVIGNKNLWDIFLNNKNKEVIDQLTKYVISFNFYFSEDVHNSARITKINNLLAKLQKHVKDGYKKNNMKLMNHSLILLKKIIDFIKETKSQTKELKLYNNSQQFRAIIRVVSDKSVVDLSVFLAETYYDIKQSISTQLGIERTQFRLLNTKDSQISQEFFQIPFCFQQEKILKVQKIGNEEQTISKNVMRFIKEKIQNTLIDMLDNEQICESAYKVLQQIDIQAEEGQFLLQKLNLIMNKNQSKLHNSSNESFQIYYNLFFLKVLGNLFEDTVFIQKFIRSGSLNQMIKRLSMSITNGLVVKFLTDLSQILHKIIKKFLDSKESDIKNEQNIRIILELKPQFKDNAFLALTEVCKYINANGVESDLIKKKFIKIFINCLNIIQITTSSTQIIGFYLNHQLFPSIFQNIFINKNMNEIRFSFAQKLKKYIKRQKLKEGDEDKLFSHAVFYYYFINDSHNQSNMHFYNLLSFFVKTFSHESVRKYVLEVNDEKGVSLYQKILTNISNEQDNSQPTGPINFGLDGNLVILASLYQRFSNLCTESMLDMILFDCLFFNVKKTNRLDVRCKKPQNIKAALEVVYSMCFNEHHQLNIVNFKYVLNAILSYHQLDYWRNSSNWNTTIQDQARSNYVGLENPGCICYLNSLLQQLFMISDFRKTIYSLNLTDKSIEDNIEEQNNEKISNEDLKPQRKLQMLETLRQLFFNLQYSEQNAINPVFFTKTIRNAENKPMVRLLVQMDIDQFCSILFDKIEQLIPQIEGQTNFIKDYFGGTYAHQIISKECSHSSQRQQQFLSIGLQVKKNILESFASLVKGQILDGENKYFCEKCDKKVKAQKMLTIKKLPKNLILSLKRFEFNYEIDAKIKMNDFCQFPIELKLKQFSQQEINKKKKSGEMIDQSQQNKQFELPQQYFTYRLKGVVVHTGSADSGHYYSFIEDKNKQWYEFNDEQVSPFDFKKLADEAFGSKDATQNKVKNAYLLFYEKVNNKSDIIQQVDVYKKEENLKIIQNIKRNNKNINKFKLFFSKDYSNFVAKIVSHFDIINSFKQIQDSWHEFYITYYLFIKLREGDIEQIIKCSKDFENFLDNDKFRILFLTGFTTFTFFEEVFLYCSNRDKLKILSDLLLKAIINQYESSLNQELQDQILNKIWANARVCIMFHGNIYEFEIVLRKFLYYLKNVKQRKTVIYLKNSKQINYLISLGKQFLPPILKNLLGYGLNKEQKEAYVEHKTASKRQGHQLFINSKNEGRKFTPADTKESWHIIEYFVEIALLMYQLDDGNEEKQLEQKSMIELVRNQIDALGVTKVANLIHECANKRTIFHLFQVFKIINRIPKLIEAVEKGLKDFESTKYRQFFLLISFIIEDSSQNENLMEATIHIFKVALKHNQKYYLQIDFMHQWILKYCQANSFFLKKVMANNEFVQDILRWILNRPAPNYQTIKKHKNPSNQRLAQRMHGILVSADPKDYQKNSKNMIQKYEKIFRGKYQPLQMFSPCPGDDRFQINEEIQFFDLSEHSWQKGKIIDISFTLLKVQKLGKNEGEVHFWQDCERIQKLTKREQVIECEYTEEMEIENELDEQDMYN